MNQTTKTHTCFFNDFMAQSASWELSPIWLRHCSYSIEPIRTTHGPAGSYQCFGGRYCLLFQGKVTTYQITRYYTPENHNSTDLRHAATVYIIMQVLFFNSIITTDSHIFNSQYKHSLLYAACLLTVQMF